MRGDEGSFIEKTKGCVKTIIRIWCKWVCLLECWPNQVRMGVLVFGNIFIQLCHGTMVDLTRCVVNIKSASGVSCNKFNNIQREQMKFAIGVRGVRFSVDIKMSVLVGFELDENHVFGTAVESQITGLRFLHENIGGRKILSGQRHERSKSV